MLLGVVVAMDLFHRVRRVSRLELGMSRCAGEAIRTGNGLINLIRCGSFVLRSSLTHAVELSTTANHVLWVIDPRFEAYVLFQYPRGGHRTHKDK